MKSLRNIAGKVVLAQTDEPRPNKGEALIRIKKTGISAGTEFFQLGKATAETNAEMGYIATGIIEEINDNDSPLRKGENVFAMCSHAEKGIRDIPHVFPIPPGVSLKAASACYWAVPALRGVHRLQPLIYDDVAVVGQGAIGLMALQLVRHVARRVVAADISSFRLKKSAELGADICLNPLEQDYVQVLGSQLPEGPSRVIEASGTKAGLELALKMVRPRGTIVTLRIAADVGGINFEQYMYRKDLRIIASGAPGMAPTREQIFNRETMFNKTAKDVWLEPWYFRKEIEVALEMIGRGYLRTDPIITHEVKADDAPDIYRKLADKTESQSILGVLIDWE